MFKFSIMRIIKAYKITKVKTLVRLSCLFALIYLNIGCFFYIKFEDLDKKSTVSSDTSGSNDLISPSPVENVVIESHSVSANLNWQNKSKPNYYTIKYGSSSGIYPILISIPIIENNFTLIDLNYDETYYMIITSHFDNDLQLDSEEYVFSTAFSCLDFLDESNLTLKGTGTELSPYIICSANQLIELSKPSSITFLDKVFKLEADIDFNNKVGFTPIGSSTDPFRGYFQGNNHTIKNWTWDSLSTDQIGLFSYIKSAKINKINFENININFGSGNKIGVLVGEASSGSQIEDIFIDNVNINGNGNEVGGVSGFASAGFLNITVGSSVNIISSGTGVGGAIGSFISEYNPSGACFQNYFLNSKVSASVKGESDVGGVIGRTSVCSSYFLITHNVEFDGSVMSYDLNSGNNFGGIVGMNSENILNNTHFKGTIVGYSKVGGIIGNSSSLFAVALIENISTGTIIGINLVGGIAGSAFNTNSHRNISKATIQGSSWVGGIFGYSGSNYIYHSIFNGTIKGNPGLEESGGLVGRTMSTSIYYSYSAPLFLSAGTYIGGIVGNSTGMIALTIGKSYWDKQLSGITNLCGNFTNVNCNTPGDLALGLTTGTLQDPSALYSFSGNDPNWSFYGIVDAAYNSPNDFWKQKSINEYPDLLWSNFDPIADGPFGINQGRGSIEDPYLIDHPDDLNSISQNKELLKKHYKLKNNIDLSLISNAFKPWRDFTGSLDGNNFNILNLSLNSPGVSTVGFISGDSTLDPLSYIRPIVSISGEKYFVAEIKNITFDNVSITGNNFVAAINATTLGNYSFNKVHVKGSVIVQGSTGGGLSTNCFEVNSSSFFGTVIGGNNIGGVCSSVYSFSNVNSGYSVTGNNQIGGAFSEINYYNNDILGIIDPVRSFVHYDGEVIGTGTLIGGVFGSLVESKVDNLTVVNTNPNHKISGLQKVGGLAGSMRSGQITNSYVKGVFSPFQITASTKVGGLVGHIGLDLSLDPSVRIQNLILNSKVSSGSLGSTASEMGGLVGSIDRTSGITIENSSFAGDILSSSQTVGGLVGYFSISGPMVYNRNTIRDSYSVANLSGTAQSTGGIIGAIDSSNDVTIERVYFAGVNSCTGISKGAIIGLNNNAIDTIYSSIFWDITKNNTLTDLGSGNLSDLSKISSQSTTQLQTKSTFENNGWDFNSVWIISGTLNSGYPTFNY